MKMKIYSYCWLSRLSTVVKNIIGLYLNEVGYPFVHLYAFSDRLPVLNFVDNRGSLKLVEIESFASYTFYIGDSVD